MTGTVYLVGAGPGDADLLTVRAHRLLGQADAVVFDRLVSPRLLNLVPDDAELHYVGKTPNHHTLAQGEINQLLVELAGRHQTVVRLKGGDPFVFGRGGEEALELNAAGVAFELVPGITSALAAPLYAGIPVTHRRISPSFTVVTGHECVTENSFVDWEALARCKGTLVVLMGVGQLPDIVSKLLGAGKPPETPIALIRWATRAMQMTLVSQLNQVVAEVELAKFASPAVIVIGDVVRLRDELAWSESRPMYGNSILAVAKSRKQAITLADELSANGADVFETWLDNGHEHRLEVFLDSLEGHSLHGIWTDSEAVWQAWWNTASEHLRERLRDVPVSFGDADTQTVCERHLPPRKGATNLIASGAGGWPEQEHVSASEVAMP